MTGLSGVFGAVEGQALAQGLVRAQHAQGSSTPPIRPTDDGAQDHAESMSRPELPEPNFPGSPSIKSSSHGAPLQHAPQAIPFAEPDKIAPMLRGVSEADRTVELEEEKHEIEARLRIPNREIPFAHMRIHFEDFAKQLRLHRHHEHRKRMLRHQRDRLGNAVALSSRLLRVGSWVHDGLVQISQQSDPTGFTRVHHHMQDLVNICQSQWHHEIHALDTTPAPKSPTKHSFFAKLSPASREDCLELLNTLRSTPRYLVDRFMAMNPDQMKGLSTSPKFRNLSESVLVSLSANRGREPSRRRPRSLFKDSEEDQQLIRSKAYSKELEDYASSFERSNPLSFLIHNVFAPSKDIGSDESQLRLSTWSTICATLFRESGPTFDAVIGDVFSAFAHLYGWQIKERLEMFLMGSLQRGAFLYNSVDPSGATGSTELGVFEALNTPQAKCFFDTEVRELFQILGSGDQGLPVGALHLGRAIVGKLPTPESQAVFRGHLLKWFLEDYLRIAMSFPEDESMLLQFHINSQARFRLLHKLWERACARANDSLSPMPTQRIDEEVQSSVNWINYQIYGEQCVDPYKTNRPATDSLESPDSPYISICAADIAHLLEKLKPQVLHTSSPFDTFMSGSQAAFHQQYSRATTRFDRLCRRILEDIEPGQSSKSVPPGQEDWTLLFISSKGNLAPAEPSPSTNISASVEGLGLLNPAEAAALRLAEISTPGRGAKNFQHLTPGTETQNGLSEMFAENSATSHIKTDSLTSMYWHKALLYLKANYPLTVLTGDDTKILEPLVQRLTQCRHQLTDECHQLGQEVAALESIYASTKAELISASESLNKLRIKLWYAIFVISSDTYEDARNISVALNNMATPTLPRLVSEYGRDSSPDPSRPGTSATSASSLFEQPRIDAESIMKAPASEGGPRKLSDSQIDKTRKWLERNHVDNFCRGEERIHRFCMEVKLVTRRLVGDTIAESPVLWSSELFAREKLLYDIHAGSALYGGPASTRPPSVMSEPLSSTLFPTRATFAGSRTSIFGGSSRFGRDGLGSDISSYISSPGRATTTTSTTLETSIWSSAQSNPRSVVTSASLQSGLPSALENLSVGRAVDRSHEKTVFLDGLRQDLSSLLLSDLACPVWSCGSESDAWMDVVCQTPAIVARLHQRSALANLLPPLVSTVAGKPSPSPGTRKHKQRSQSAAPQMTTTGTQELGLPLDSVEKALFPGGAHSGRDGFPYHNAFHDILCRVRDHTDPTLKLKAIRDFKMLSKDFHQSQLKKTSEEPTETNSRRTGTDDASRRLSLDPSVLSINMRRKRQSETQTIPNTSAENEEHVIVQSLKNLLLLLRPKTIFRDLQYIAVFVSSDHLDNAELGQALLHVGLAALAWKDEVCRAMVEVADRIVTKDSIKRSISKVRVREPSILKAMEYWIIGAREGNAIAQRELASLYLTHPDVPPIVSLPLASSSDIFKREMMWEGEGDARSKMQALCLALHWMQEASKNKDDVAQRKLREREAGRSIR